MDKTWSDKAWEDYEYWQKHDRKMLAKINQLLKDIERNGADRGIGKPERLKHRKAWSRRIDDSNRLIYDVLNSKVCVYACKGHYPE